MYKEKKNLHLKTHTITENTFIAITAHRQSVFELFCQGSYLSGDYAIPGKIRR